MQTYLPLPDCAASAAILDDRRLNKQRSDIMQLLKKLAEPASDEDHPLVKMWRGNELFLIDKYAPAIMFEWMSRENNDNTLIKVMEFRKDYPVDEGHTDDPPEWFGDPVLHDAHKSYLLRLEPSKYRQHWPDVSDELPMVWPRSPAKQRANRPKREAQRLLNKAKRAYEKALESIQEAARNLLDSGLEWPTDLSQVGELPTVAALFGEEELDDLGSEANPTPIEPVDEAQLLIDFPEPEEVE